jgi:MFS family permease
MNMSIQSAPYGKQATAVGFYQAVYAISMFAGPALAGGGSEFFGLKGGFILASVVGVIAFSLSFYCNNIEKSFVPLEQKQEV